MDNLQLKLDYFLDERIKGIVNVTMEGGDATHLLLLLASKVIKRKEYDGRTITVSELELSFKDCGNVWLDDVLYTLKRFEFIEVDTNGMITVLENELWELV